MTTRLVSFLGKGDYRETAYRWRGIADRQVATRYVAATLAQLAPADQVVILATGAAEATHGQGLTDAFSALRLPAPSFVRLADGKNPPELWDNFRVVKEEVMRPGADKVIVDITHGFRSQPFFAGAVLGFVRAFAESAAEVQVVYGAYDAREGDGPAPIWDLTAFSELADWAHALGHFLRTGDARAASAAATRIGRRLSREWAEGDRQGAAPRVTGFARALQEFSDALVTVRVGELLLQRGKDDRPSAGPARVHALGEALERSRAELERHIPPVAEVLERVDRVVDHLDVESIEPGDTVIGSLPVDLAARVCERGGRYLHLALELPAGLRGTDLTAEDMRRLGARIEEYRVVHGTGD